MWWGLGSSDVKAFSTTSVQVIVRSHFIDGGPSQAHIALYLTASLRPTRDAKQFQSSRMAGEGISLLHAIL